MRAHRRAARRHRRGALAIDEVNTSIYASGAACSARRCAGSAPTTPRASTTSPTWSRCCAGMGHRVGTVRRARADETQGVNDRWQLAARRGRAAEPHQRALAAATASPCSTRARTYIDATVQLGRDVTLFPGTILQGDTVDRRRRRDRSRHPARRLRGRARARRRAHRRPRRRDRRRRPRRPVRRAGSRAASVACGAATGPFYTARVADVEADWRWTPSRRPMEKVTTKRLRSYSGGRTRRWPRRSPSTWASTLGEPNLREFANGEIHCRVRRVDPRRRRVHHPDPLRLDGAAVNDSIMEQLIMIDAAKRASAKRITAVCPFYGYARQDRKAEGREPITAKLVADMFKAAGAKRMVVGRPALRPDPGLLRRPGRPPHRHAGADRLPAPARRDDLVDRVARRRPGEGGRALSPSTSRRRPGLRPQAPARRARPTRSRPRDVIGDVDGRLCVLIDDMIDTAGTIVRRRRHPASSAAPPRCGPWPPTACSPARPSTG